MKTIVTAIVWIGVLAAVGAQQPAFSRTVLQQMDISVPGREVVTAIATIQPGGVVGRHSHPGEEIGYILEGTVLVEQEGKPSVTIGPGKIFAVPTGTVHNATNTGSTVARVLATYIVEKGKPLATPAAK
jgi:quercetin dioxygenase-like cupin family protein